MQPQFDGSTLVLHCNQLARMQSISHLNHLDSLNPERFRNYKRDTAPQKRGGGGGGSESSFFPQNEVNTAFIAPLSVGQKRLLIHPSLDTTDCIQRTMKPSPLGWKTLAHAASDYGQLGGSISFRSDSDQWP